MPRPLLPAALVLAAGVVPAAAADGPAAAVNDNGEAVVRLSVPAAPAAGVEGEDGVVVRAQNRAGRGRKQIVRPTATRRPVRRVAHQHRPAAPQPAPAPAPAPVRPVSGQYGGEVIYEGPVHGGVTHGGMPPGTTVCPQCNGNCPPGVSCPGCLGSGLFCPGGYFNRGGVWSPRHVHNYSYNAPRNLSYPQGAANPATPGAQGPMPMVQYPYYTTKGPDDFFTDRDGEF